jgi:hypothetical protein
MFLGLLDLDPLVRGMDPDTRLLAWTIEYNGINNIMGFASKKLPYNITKNVFERLFFFNGLDLFFYIFIHVNQFSFSQKTQ